MIRSVKIEDLEEFNKLGILVNSNFTNLFQLDKLINSDIDYVLGDYENDKLVGFIHFTKLYETIDIVNVVVSEQFRNKGIASNLINYIVNNYKDINNIMLEVNVNNIAAINLYLKNGFKEIYRRKKYYGDEDAIIMKRDV